jgi:RNA polymerase sigma-B factor
LRVEDASRHLAARTGRAANVGELAQYLELDTEQVLAGLEAGSAHFARSLDAPVATPGTDDDEPLHAQMGEVEDGYALVEMAASLAAALPRLPYLERRALTLRLRDDLKQTEIAEQLNCSQMQVSRLLRRAGTRLRELTDPDITQQAGGDRPPPPGESHILTAAVASVLPEHRPRRKLRSPPPPRQASSSSHL